MRNGNQVKPVMRPVYEKLKGEVHQRGPLGQRRFSMAYLALKRSFSRDCCPITAESISMSGAAVPSSSDQLNDILTIGEVAEILRCSRNHVSNVMNGKVPRVPALPHFVMGRRKLVRREWLIEWLQSYRTQC